MVLELLSALLGVTLMLPRVQALTCQSGTMESVVNTSALSFQWTPGQDNCQDGWGCQETLMIIENGPKALLVIIKGCTLEKDHDLQVTQHRTGPGLSIISYTYVCRGKDFCNQLSTSLPVRTDYPSRVPESSVRCPFCLSTKDCESATELKCPVGGTHCYNGVLQLTGDSLKTHVRVQGCMSQAACDLLNQTQKIGPLSLRENCSPNALLTCQQGVMFNTQKILTPTPTPWKAFRNVSCGLEEVCQETLLLIDVGPQSHIVGTKGCSKAQTQNSRAVTIHSARPGVLVASYAHFCSSSGCNNAQSSSVLLNSLRHPAAPAPGDLQCPACVGLHGSCTNIVTCPKGTSHCYSGSIKLRGRMLTSAFNVQGCVAQRSSSLLNHSNIIGELYALEASENDDDPLIQDRAGAASGPCRACVVGLGLCLAFLWGGALPADPISHEYYSLLTP